jgi:hypothetical protein
MRAFRRRLFLIFAAMLESQLRPIYTSSPVRKLDVLRKST